jgi:hypothetical protein
MSSKSNSNASSLKRKVQVVQQVSPLPSSSTSSKQIKKEPAVEKLKVDIELLIFTEYIEI